MTDEERTFIYGKLMKAKEAYQPFLKMIDLVNDYEQHEKEINKNIAKLKKERKQKEEFLTHNDYAFYKEQAIKNKEYETEKANVEEVDKKRDYIEELKKLHAAKNLEFSKIKISNLTEEYIKLNEEIDVVTKEIERNREAALAEIDTDSEIYKSLEKEVQKNEAKLKELLDKKSKIDASIEEEKENRKNLMKEINAIKKKYASETKDVVESENKIISRMRNRVTTRLSLIDTQMEAEKQYLKEYRDKNRLDYETTKEVLESLDISALRKRIENYSKQLGIKVSYTLEPELASDELRVHIPKEPTEYIPIVGEPVSMDLEDQVIPSKPNEEESEEEIPTEIDEADAIAEDILKGFNLEVPTKESEKNVETEQEKPTNEVEKALEGFSLETPVVGSTVLEGFNLEIPEEKAKEEEVEKEEIETRQTFGYRVIKVAQEAVQWLSSKWEAIKNYVIVKDDEETPYEDEEANYASYGEKLQEENRELLDRSIENTVSNLPASEENEAEKALEGFDLDTPPTQKTSTRIMDGHQVKMNTNMVDKLHNSQEVTTEKEDEVHLAFPYGKPVSMDLLMNLRDELNAEIEKKEQQETEETPTKS